MVFVHSSTTTCVPQLNPGWDILLPLEATHIRLFRSTREFSFRRARKCSVSMWLLFVWWESDQAGSEKDLHLISLDWTYYIKSKKNLWSWRKRTTLVYVGVQWIGCVQVRVQLTENWKMAHKETLLPLLLQLFLVPSVFLLIPIPPQNKSPGPERGISIISHAHEQQEHSWPPPSKAAADMCAPFVPVGNLSVTWSGIRGGWIYLSLSLQAPGHTSGMVWNFLEKKLFFFFVFFKWTQHQGTWINLFILFLWMHRVQLNNKLRETTTKYNKVLGKGEREI